MMRQLASILANELSFLGEAMQAYGDELERNTISKHQNGTEIPTLLHNLTFPPPTIESPSAEHSGNLDSHPARASCEDKIPRVSVIQSKLSKRRRVNWSVQEHHQVLKAIQTYAGLPDQDLLLKVEQSMCGRRTLAQVKCKFRTLLANGMIRRCSTIPIREDVNLWALCSQSFSKPRKRKNWTHSEQEVIMELVKKYGSLDEDCLVQKISSTLSGRRTWLQVRRHFDVMKHTGQVKKSNDSNPHWYIPKNEVFTHRM